jgi:hypothetical protein
MLSLFTSCNFFQMTSSLHHFFVTGQLLVLMQFEDSDSFAKGTMQSDPAIRKLKINRDFAI